MSGMGGLNPLQYSEILAFFTLINIEPSELEVEILKRLDMVCLKAHAEQFEKDSKARKANQKK